jgi:lysophospholipase L1-like esterase
MSRLANCILFCSSLIVGLTLVEIGIRLLAPQPMNGSVFEYAPRGYNVLKSKGTAPFEVGASKGVYHLTSPHLRGMPPPANAVRILVLGDSFTFGVGLAEEDTYVARLQRKINTVHGAGRVALLNAGIGGSGTAEHLAFLEDFGDEIAPRAVIVFVSIDDFNRAQRSGLYNLRSTDSFVLDEAALPTRPLKILVQDSDIYNFVIQHVHIAQLIRRVVIGLVFPSYPAPESLPAKELKSMNSTSADQQRLVRALFRRMKAWCDLRGVKLAVVNNGWQSYNWLPELLVSERISAFDAAPQVQSVIGSDPASYIIQGDGHPNAKGSAVVAEAVWPFVENFIGNSEVLSGFGTRP